MLRNPVPSVPLAAPVQQPVAPMQQPGAPGLVAPTSDTWRGTLGRLRGHERRYGDNRAESRYNVYGDDQFVNYRPPGTQ